jgi:catechol 2,3-dioxygenase-like lactoylglutathione lyase family enzyme
MYRGVQIGPSSSLMMDNVNIIVYPWEYARSQYPEAWKGREDFDSTQGHTTDHIGFGVDKLDETLARLKADGVKITDQPRAIAGTKVRSAFIEGPDHLRIELVEEQAHKD